MESVGSVPSPRVVVTAVSSMLKSICFPLSPYAPNFVSISELVVSVGVNDTLNANVFPEEIAPSKPVRSVHIWATFNVTVSEWISR
ncbi:hypothetical protein ES703_112678 [subsurface metagenome]